MVSIIAEKKGNNTFYFMRHKSGEKQLKRYLGKTIPKNIEQLKIEFLLEFYHNQWNHHIQMIYQKYQKESKTIPMSIKIQNFENFGIYFTYNTQKIEGSKLTQEDTKDLLIHGITPNKKSKIDTIETLKHYDLFVTLVNSELKKITLDTILNWHKEIFGQTKIGESGSIRTYNVGILGNDKIEFSTVPQIKPKLKKLFNLLDKYDGKITPVELACIVHYNFINIHPFGDGNGRITRLLVNYILLKYNYPLMLIQNKDRKAYFKSLERSQLEDNSIHFLKWFMKYYIKNNKKYL
ncbi:MAG: Fic family protein [Candidatus Nitrosopelagicus sp.]|nr:Fic family protein [Candidatus Nitrosopelagicus sp.]